MFNAPSLTALIALVLRNRDECAGETADIGRCHNTALFHLIVQKCQRCCRSRCTCVLEADLLKDIRNGISDRRSRCQGKVNDTKRNVQPLGSLLCNELADTRYLKCGFLDRLAKYLKVLAAYFFQACLTTPGPETPTLMMASASVTHGAPAMNGLSSVHYETTSFAHPRQLFSLLCLHASSDDLTHQFDSIHVNTGFGGAKVDGAADKIP